MGSTCPKPELAIAQAAPGPKTTFRTAMAATINAGVIADHESGWISEAQ
jgi:hypothetical protein